MKSINGTEKIKGVAMNYKTITHVILCLINCLVAVPISCMERPVASLGGIQFDLKAYMAKFLSTQPSMELLARDIRSLAQVDKTFNRVIQNPVTMLGILQSLPHTAQAIELGEKLKGLQVMKDKRIIEWLADQKKKLVNGPELVHAVESGDVAKVHRLLKDRNIDLNYNKAAPLMSAAARKNEATIKALLAAGANVNEGPANSNSLLFAVRNAASEMITSKDWQRLDADIQIIQMLIKAGANVDQQDKNERTALMVAVASGLKPLISILLDAGADPELKDSIGRTVMMQLRPSAQRISQFGDPLSERYLRVYGPLDFEKEKEAVINMIARQRYAPQVVNKRRIKVNRLIKLIEDAQSANDYSKAYGYVLKLEDLNEYLGKELRKNLDYRNSIKAWWSQNKWYYDR